MKRFVITGATSFLGSNLLNELSKSDVEIFAIVRPNSKNKDILYSSGNINVLNFDICDIKNIVSIIGLADEFFHFAWDGIGSVGRSNKEIQDYNITNSMHALSAASTLGCKRFYFAGSQAEYGNKLLSQKESDICNPVSEYGKAKLAFGKQAYSFCKEKSMEYIHPRIFSVYGKGDHPTSLVNSCIKSFENGEILKMGSCCSLWNYIHISDLIKQLLLLLDLPCGEFSKEYTINLAGTDTRILSSFVEDIYELSSKKGSYVFGEREENAEGISNLNPDISRIISLTNYNQKVDFKSGIIKLIENERQKTK